MIFLLIFTIFIRGEVKDEKGKALIFANVYFKNSTIGTITDKEGKFEIPVVGGDSLELVVSFIGYEKKVLKFYKLKEDTFITVLLSSSVYKFPPIVVSGDYSISDLSQNIDAPTETFSKMDVIETPGACADVFFTLKDLPSIGGIADVSPLYIRGGAPYENLVLINGIPFLYPHHLEGAGGGMFGVVEEKHLEKLDLFLTPPPRYGGRLSGVVALSTKTFYPNEFSGSIGVSMAHISGRITGYNAQISVSKNYFDLFNKFFGVGEDFTIYPSYWAGQVSGGYRVFKNLIIKPFGIISGDKMGVDLKKQDFEGEFKSKSKKELYGSQGLWMSNKRYIDFGVGVGKYEKIEEIGRPWKKEYYETYYSGHIHYSQEIERRNFLELGINTLVRVYSFKVIYPQDSTEWRDTTTAKDTMEIIGKREEVESFVQHKFNIGERVSVIYGLHSGYLKANKSKFIEPRVNTNFKLFSFLILKLGVGIFHQFPSEYELDSVWGNKELSPSKAIHYTGGIEFPIRRKISLRVDIYKKEYTKLPLPCSLYNFLSVGKGYTHGIEILMRKKREGNFWGWIAYSFSRAFREKEEGKLYPFDFDTPHNLTGVINWYSPLKLSIGMKLKYLTGRPFTPIIKVIKENEKYHPVYGEYNSSRYPNYLRMDLRITKIFQFTNSLVMYLEVINLTNNKNVISYTYSKDYTPQELIFIERCFVLGGEFHF